MARARIELREGASYSFGPSVVFEKGAPRIETNVGLIERCRANSAFSVTDLPEEGSKAPEPSAEQPEPEAETQVESEEPKAQPAPRRKAGRRKSRK